MLKATNTTEVPVCLTGFVQRIGGPDFCMDGAQYLIASTLGQFRLIADDAELMERLEEAAMGRGMDAVCGYKRQGAECEHIAVYWVGSPAELQELR